MRADQLQKNPTEEYDYTTVANYLMAFGIYCSQKYQFSSEEIDEINSYIGDRFSLGEHGLIDALEDLYRDSDAEPLEEKVSAKRKEGPKPKQ